MPESSRGQIRLPARIPFRDAHAPRALVPHTKRTNCTYRCFEIKDFRVEMSGSRRNSSKAVRKGSHRAGRCSAAVIEIFEGIARGWGQQRTPARCYFPGDLCATIGIAAHRPAVMHVVTRSIDLISDRRQGIKRGSSSAAGLTFQTIRNNVPRKFIGLPFEHSSNHQVPLDIGSP